MPSRRASGATRARAGTSTSSSSTMSGRRGTGSRRGPRSLILICVVSLLKNGGWWLGGLAAASCKAKNPTKNAFGPLSSPRPRERELRRLGVFCAFPSRQIHVLFRFAQPLTFTQFLGSLHFFDPQTCGVTVVTQQHVAKGVRTASGAREERHGRRPGGGRGGVVEPRLIRTSQRPSGLKPRAIGCIS